MATSGTQQPALDFGRALYGLFQQAIYGVAHLNAAKSILEARRMHPALLAASPLFFDLTTLAHLDAAQLYAAKLFEEGKRNQSVTIPWLLEQAKQHRREFSQRTHDEQDEGIKEAEQVYFATSTLTAVLKHRRDKWLAHLDKQAVTNPEKVTAYAKLTISQLEGLLACATAILNTLADLCAQPGFLIHPDDYNDLSRTLGLVEKGLK
jgi:AbiU2